MKNDLNKLMSEFRQKRDLIDQNLSHLEKLNSLIMIVEQDMQLIKKRQN